MVLKTLWNVVTLDVVIIGSLRSWLRRKSLRSFAILLDPGFIWAQV
jgi:hypothetical protein